MIYKFILKVAKYKIIKMKQIKNFKINQKIKKKTINKKGK